MHHVHAVQRRERLEEVLDQQLDLALGEGLVLGAADEERELVRRELHHEEPLPERRVVRDGVHRNHVGVMQRAQDCDLAQRLHREPLVLEVELELLQRDLLALSAHAKVDRLVHEPELPLAELAQDSKLAERAALERPRLAVSPRTHNAHAQPELKCQLAQEPRASHPPTLSQCGTRY